MFLENCLGHSGLTLIRGGAVISFNYMPSKAVIRPKNGDKFSMWSLQDQHSRGFTVTIEYTCSEEFDRHWTPSKNKTLARLKKTSDLITLKNFADVTKDAFADLEKRLGDSSAAPECQPELVELFSKLMRGAFNKPGGTTSATPGGNGRGGNPNATPPEYNNPFGVREKREPSPVPYEIVESKSGLTSWLNIYLNNHITKIKRYGQSDDASKSFVVDAISKYKSGGSLEEFELQQNHFWEQIELLENGGKGE